MNRRQPGPDMPCREQAVPSPQQQSLGECFRGSNPGKKRSSSGRRSCSARVPGRTPGLPEGTKEHEAILATDAQPRQIHAGLLLTGAEPGHPVRFEPKFEPPAGTPIAIELLWMTDGKLHRSDARNWFRATKARSPWQRTGSSPVAICSPIRVTKKMIYAADEGDLITVANFGSAILDLPLAKPGQQRRSRSSSRRHRTRSAARHRGQAVVLPA